MGIHIEKNKNNSEVWVILVDPKKFNVITLYSIDLGLGLEFNQEYIQKLLTKLGSAKAHLSKVKSQVDSKYRMYGELVAENETVLNEYTKIIHSLEKQNNGYKEVMNNLQVAVTIAEKEVKSVVSTMIGKKLF